MQVAVEREFENIYLFISDALRYDSVPESVAANNTIVRTVSSSPMSCTAFPTLISGRYPPEHGVWTFSDVLPAEMDTVFDLFPGDSACFMAVESVADASTSGANYADVTAFEDHLSELTPPFAVLDRELCTHTPYGFEHSEHISEEERFTDGKAYLTERKSDFERLRADYREGARLAGERFRERIGILNDRGLLKDTLVIFTADHGELLGEYGRVTHGMPLVPELAYVPTVFYGEGVTATGDIMGHVDVYPTVAAAVGAEVPEVSGSNLVAGAPDDRLFYAEDRNLLYREWAAWDAGGGHVFTDGSFVDRLLATAHGFVRANKAPIHRRNPVAYARGMLRGERTMGEPRADRAEAHEFCDRVAERTWTDGRRSIDLDPEAKDRLRALGYSEEEIE